MFKKRIELEVVIATNWCTALGSEVEIFQLKLQLQEKIANMSCTHEHTMALYVKYLNDFL
jgi:hypothetical protein